MYVIKDISTVSFPNGSVIKNLPVNARDTGEAGAVPGLGRSFGVKNGNPLQYSFFFNFFFSLQYSYLKNPMDRAWRATVHAVTKSQNQLSICP